MFPMPRCLQNSSFVYPRFTRPGLVLVALLLVPAGCRRSESAAPGGSVQVDDQAAVVSALTLRTGDFERRLPLTGEIDAVAALELKVPRVPNGQVAIRYLAAEGAEVKAGDVVVELDSTTFVLEIKDRTLAMSQAEIDLQRQISQNGVLEADKALEVERKRAVVRRAEVDADVPEGILPQRDFLEKKLILARARADQARAEEALAAQQNADASDVALKRIALDKIRRAVKAAEDSIATLTLRATAPGTVLLGDHPEERRKVQESDAVPMGLTVARVSGSSARRARAWLSDVDDGKIAVGMPARVVLDAHPDRSFAGTVREISPVARAPGDARVAQRRVFTVLVDLIEADAAVLRPGLSARVDVLVNQRSAMLLAPRVAIDWSGESPRAMLAGGGAQSVRLEGCNGDVCVVEKGLGESSRLRRVNP